MIDVEIPIGLIWLLRWLLFLFPLGAITVLAWINRHKSRVLIGALFAFLYGAGTIFITHQIAIALGWWTYGGDALMLNGLPVDIWLGGALLFGPVLSLCFPRMAPIYILLPIVIGLHGMVFLSLEPLVYAGQGWFLGVLFVFLIAHLPAIYLSRWTADERLLPVRAALLAFGFGFLAFAALPSITMAAMGGAWGVGELSLIKLIIGAPAILICFVLGLTAVQMFVVHGDGTPIPLDPTKRLVRTGIYAYLVNPMQLSSALTWAVTGFIIGNIWVASAALMAWVFVIGMVRYHHRHDLLKRFPDGWPEYRAHVSEWRPRWRPWIKEKASLTYNQNDKTQRRVVTLLQNQNAIGLDMIAKEEGELTYQEPNEYRLFIGLSAFAKAVNHIHFIWCLIGAAILLVTLPINYLRRGAIKT